MIVKQAPCSRSAVKHQKELEKADQLRRSRLEDGKLSLPSGLGRLVIIVSGAVDHRFFYSQPRQTGALQLNPEQQRQATLELADRLKQQRASQHQQVDVRRRAVVGDMKLDFADPEVTDMIFIGHGSISEQWADGGRHFDWRQASKAASYLKRGKIEQRMCGHFARPDGRNVPLGTFAVANVTDVVAATGLKLNEAQPADHYFQPVYASGQNVLEQIAELNQTYADQASPKKP